MKKLLVVPIFLLLAFNSTAQDINSLIKEADKLEDIPNELAAFNKFKDVLKMQPNHVYSLAKASQLGSRIGSRETNSKSRDAWYATAFNYANKAVSISPLNDEGNVSLAMVLGKSSLTKSGKEKLKSAKEIKKRVDIALKTNPHNYLAWHILGRWNYELSNISSVERTAAKIFFGGIPSGSIKNAIMYFEKARTLMPYFILNYIELAKAYHKDGQVSKAIALMNTIQSFPLNTEDDARLKIEGLRMSKGWEEFQ
jgi:tetratricopeptide (TPR) repeat protein